MALAPPEGCQAGFRALGFLPSSISLISLSTFTEPHLLNPTEPVQQRLDYPAEHRIHDIEIGSKRKHGHDDYGGRGTHFLPRRRGYLAHFAAHVPEEIRGPSEHSGELIALSGPVLSSFRQLVRDFYLAHSSLRLGPLLLIAHHGG